MNLELEAQTREILGRRVASLRKQNIIPAELYGNGVENIHLSLKESDFLQIYREAGENTIVNLIVNGEKRPVFVHDVQTDPVSGRVLTADLYQVDLTKKTITHVPLTFVGESPLVESAGGILNKVLDEVEVEALPINIPHEIEVDVSVLDDFNKNIRVADLAGGKDFEIKTEPETVVASISEPREEEKEVVEELSPEDVEVVGKEKPEGEEEEEGTEDKEDSGKS
ncbi:MAG: 50S ribosomal protein L25 [Candidatus Colwellbacteria bacterium]|nr:50S ribosomal protein L25 [Candidatus Colwellbacteria bacterium]